MAKTSAEAFVLSIWSEAQCTGPSRIYWPGSGERTAYIVIKHPMSSAVEGIGGTEQEAWEDASRRLNDKPMW